MRTMVEYNESICRSCFHSYVCEQFNENKNLNNKKCHFFNDHFVPTTDVVLAVRCKDCKNAITVKDNDFLQDYVWCYHHGDKFISKENYCSFAIRRDNDG